MSKFETLKHHEVSRPVKCVAVWSLTWQRYAWASLVRMTESSPRRKVKMEERRKHHHFLSTRHSSLSIRGMPWPQYASLHYTLWVLLTSGAKVSILSPIFIVKDVCIPHFSTSDVSEIRKMQKWHNIHFSQDRLGL